MKNITIFFALSFLFASCTVPSGKKQTDHADEPELEKNRGTAISHVVEDAVSPVNTGRTPLAPDSWPGMSFIVLQKQDFVKSLGYELYLCEKDECDTATIDPAWELDNHRIRCEKLAGETLSVEAVRRDGEEWKVSFIHSSTKRRVFGRTRMQTIPEIVAVEDLEGARLRWLGKTVFSRRGIISASGTNSGSSLKSLRVRIQDSLTVIDIRPGTTPLPVKPIWLMVQSKNGVSGFIPIRFSWTNTIPEEIRECAPWDEDILEDDPAATFKWDEDVWDLVNNHRVIIGMTTDQVRMSWGEPLYADPVEDTTGGRTIMTYISHELVFSDGKLISIRERPQPSK